MDLRLLHRRLACLAFRALRARAAARGARAFRRRPLPAGGGPARLGRAVVDRLEPVPRHSQPADPDAGAAVHPRLRGHGGRPVAVRAMALGAAGRRRLRAGRAGVHAGPVPAPRAANAGAGLRRRHRLSGAAARDRRGRRRGAVAPAPASHAGLAGVGGRPGRLRHRVDGLGPRLPPGQAASGRRHRPAVLGVRVAAGLGRVALVARARRVPAPRPAVRGAAAADPARDGRGHVGGRRLLLAGRRHAAPGAPAAARSVRDGAGVGGTAPDPAVARSRPAAGRRARRRGRPGAPAAPRAPRPAHRPAQSRAAARSGHPGAGSRTQARPEGGADVHRPRPLQGGQRHAGPRHRRRAAVPRGRRVHAHPARARHGVPPGRRRVRHRAARRRLGGERRAGRRTRDDAVQSPRGHRRP